MVRLNIYVAKRNFHTNRSLILSPLKSLSSCHRRPQERSHISYVSKSRAGFYKGRNKKEEKKYVLSGSFNLTDTPEESPMYGTFSIEEN